jgi:asparagine synthase (glutamine-hydrolysing)
MCGIVALYSPRGTISPSALEQATLQLAHRGPDGQRTWVSGDGRVGLGHARLSIIDLATGEQPIASEDEGLRIVVNGEFYDFERVQRDLEGRGHRLRTRFDGGGSAGADGDCLRTAEASVPRAALGPHAG